jgi:hypothetical protein
MVLVSLRDAEGSIPVLVLYNILTFAWRNWVR